MTRLALVGVPLLWACTPPLWAQQTLPASPPPSSLEESKPSPPPEPPRRVPSGARIFIAPSEGFEIYLAAALRKKEVPVVVVTNKEQADFEITSTTESHKPGWASTIFAGKTRADVNASMSVVHIKSGAIVYAYAASKENAWHGQQSAAESCAKHLKSHMEGKD